MFFVGIIKRPQKDFNFFAGTTPPPPIGTVTIEILNRKNIIIISVWDNSNPAGPAEQEIKLVSPNNQNINGLSVCIESYFYVSDRAAREFPAYRMIIQLQIIELNVIIL